MSSPTTVRFDPEIKELLVLISEDMHLKQAQAIRYAIKELARSRGLKTKKDEQ